MCYRVFCIAHIKVTHGVEKSILQIIKQCTLQHNTLCGNKNLSSFNIKNMHKYKVTFVLELSL